MNEKYFDFNENVKNAYGEMLYYHFMKTFAGAFTKIIYDRYINNLIPRSFDFETVFLKFVEKNGLENYTAFNKLFIKEINFVIPADVKDFTHDAAAVYMASIKVYNQAITKCVEFLKTNPVAYSKVHQYGTKTSDFLASHELTASEARKLEKKYADKLHTQDGKSM